MERGNERRKDMRMVRRREGVSSKRKRLWVREGEIGDNRMKTNNKNGERKGKRRKDIGMVRREEGVFSKRKRWWWVRKKEMGDKIKMNKQGE